MLLQQLVPVLDVHDVDRSIEFYTETLGFVVYDRVEWGGRTEWALLRVGRVQVMLCVSDDNNQDEEPLHNEGVFFVYLDNLEDFRKSIEARKYQALAAAREVTQSGRDFYVRDPDGYILWFSHKPLDGEEQQQSVRQLAA
jgi:catechol 2,3-dioxygenase-like lactoylglutathione lyase family enzyme